MQGVQSRLHELATWVLPHNSLVSPLHSQLIHLIISVPGHYRPWRPDGSNHLFFSRYQFPLYSGDLERKSKMTKLGPLTTSREEDGEE